MASSAPHGSSGALPPEPGGSGRAAGQEEKEKEKGEAAPARLKEAAGASLASLCLGPPGGRLLECLLLNYRLRLGLARGRAAAAAEGSGAAEGPLRCCGCRRFLGEPVTVPCGHTYCRRCLRRELRARCRRCRARLVPGAPARPSVVLSQLAEKWFPAECERARAGSRLEELLAQGRFREALGAAGQALRAGEAGARLGAADGAPPGLGEACRGPVA